MRNFTAKSIGRLRQVTVLIALLCVTTPLFAQSDDAPAENGSRPGEEIFQVIAPESSVKMVNLDSRIVELGNRIVAVDGFDASIISVKALSPTQVRIHAESSGVTSFKLIDEFDSVFRVEVFVEPDTRELQAYLKRLFPGSAVEAIGLKDGVVLRGWVTDPTHIPQIIEVAEQFYPTVHTQMNVGGVSQVQLHVKIMEIQRSKMREFGFNWHAIGQQYAVSSTVGGLSSIAGGMFPFGGPPAPNIVSEGTELSFAITGNNEVFRGFLQALQTEALAKILAEPVLVTTSGRPASMLSGGEFPVLVPQGVGAVSIEFKEFGVRMEAVPIVLGNGRLRLDIAPEVSDRDVSNSITVDGLVVPGISVRRVNTQVEMKFGETLMIGGLIQTNRTGTTQKVPFLGELPWIGAAFSTKQYTIGETELLILVTPQMAAPIGSDQPLPPGPGLNSDIPVDCELYFDGLLEVPVYGPECQDCGPYQGGLIVPGQSYHGQTPVNCAPLQQAPAVDQPAPLEQAPPVPAATGDETAQRSQRSRFLQLVNAEDRDLSASTATQANYQFSVEADRSDRIRQAGGELENWGDSSTSTDKEYATIPERSKSKDLIFPR